MTVLNCRLVRTRVPVQLKYLLIIFFVTILRFVSRKWMRSVPQEMDAHRENMLGQYFVALNIFKARFPKLSQC